MKHSTKLKAGVAAIAGSAVAASSASALTSTFTVAVEFFDPFSITEATPANFGRLISEVATTYSLLADNTLNPGAGGSQTGAVAAVAGSYTIADSSTGGAIDITVNNAVANGGVTIDAFNCDWATGTATATNAATCAFDAQAGVNTGGSPLLVGFDITVDGTQLSGATAAPTFDITVAYD